MMRVTSQSKRPFLLFFVSLFVVVLICYIGVLTVVNIIPDILSFGAWQPLPSIGPAIIRSIAVIDSSTIAAGLSLVNGENGGLAISYDCGKTWFRTSLSQYNEVTSIIRPDQNEPALFVSMFNNKNNDLGGLYYSPDLGKTWHHRTTDPNLLDIRSIIHIPGPTNKLFAGTVKKGIYLSTDKGNHWERTDNGLSSSFIQHLAVSSVDSQLVFAATAKGLFKSEDQAKSWQFCQFDEQLPINMVLQVIPHPNNVDIVYALDRPKGLKTLIWRSMDRGKSWKRCGWSGLPSEFHPRWLVIDPGNPDDLYIGTIYDGVYCSTNRGESWFPMNRGLPIDQANIIVHALAFMPSQPPTLLAGTDYKGHIFSTTVSISSFKRFLSLFSIEVLKSE